VIATRFDSRGRRADGSRNELRRADGSRGELRRAPRAQRPRPESKPERQVGTPGDVRPRDLDIEAPEFEPSR
jgi:hypothetical protein